MRIEKVLAAKVIIDDSIIVSITTTKDKYTIPTTLSLTEYRDIILNLTDFKYLVTMVLDLHIQKVSRDHKELVRAVNIIKDILHIDITQNVDEIKNAIKNEEIESKMLISLSDNVTNSIQSKE